MLSNQDILKRIKLGELSFSPFKEEMVRGCGVTLHLGSKLLKPQPGQLIDVRKKGSPLHQSITISNDSPYYLTPGEFVLGHTLQRVSVGATLGFLIEGRSTLARVGLTIVQTAMLVYPGHKDRCITLELANHGPNTVLLYPLMKIARAAIIALETPSTELYDTDGKYREQEDVGPPIFENEFFDT